MKMVGQKGDRGTYERKDRQKDGQTLLYRTLSANTRAFEYKTDFLS